jgi:hypothetical protein
MFQTIELIEPYLVGLALLSWELFVGWCFWSSIRSDVGLDRGRPVSDRNVETVKPSVARADRGAGIRTPYVPTASA